MFAILEVCKETWETYRNIASPATGIYLETFFYGLMQIIYLEMKDKTSEPPEKSKDKPKNYTFIYVGAGVAFLVIVLLIVALIVTRLRR